MTPALLTSSCSGPSHAATKARTESRSARSSRPTPTAVLAGLRQGAGGLDPDAGGAAGDDRPVTGEVDAVDHFVGRGLKAKRGGDEFRGGLS
jgi:hypothetical protein